MAASEDAASALRAEVHADGVQHVRFDSRWLPPARQTGAWCEILHPQISVAPLRNGPRELAGSIDAWLVGEHILAVTEFRAQRAIRDRRLVAAHAPDLYHIMLHMRGRVPTDSDGNETVVEAGDIIIDDLGRPKHTTSGGGAILTFSVPRAIVEGMFPGRDLHGVKLSGKRPQTRLLRSHLLHYFQRIGDMDPGHMAELQRATHALVAAAIEPSLGEREDIRGYVQQGVRRAIEAFVERHLGDPDVNAATVQRRFRISRSQLYRLFRDDAGLAAYLRRRRAERAAELLLDRDRRHLGVSVLALEAGFRSETQCQRALRSLYGTSAREIRRSAEVYATAGGAWDAVRLFRHADTLVRETWGTDAG